MIKVFWIASSNVVQVERHKNSPNHTHSLSEIDRLKRPKAIRSLVEIEAVKNYSAPTITSAVKEYATLELGLSEPARELKRKEVANIKYKVRGPAETYLIGNPNLKLDISDSISYLTEQGYHIEKYCISQRSIRGIVFAHPEQLKKLERHGWLTLIDSTHKTNRYDWRLFILYVRITYGCWNVGAHFFVSNEDADTVAEALTIIRNNELKKTTSSSHGLIGAAHKVVNVESASFDFRIKKISAYGVDVDILEEIQKFPFPFQQLIIREACAVMNRLEKEKSTPGLTSLDCFCLFCHRYLLPYKHIFHEHMYGNKLLTTNVWQMFCKIFEESGFKVYESRESFIEYRVEEMGDVKKTQSFISMLEVSVNLIILQFDNNSSRKT
uniref:ZSWIM1/3 RNaseH-like domain-containing protein n=1 Tax=Rhizophagus irregularis (strain DAOM 181602 / DAOM 197198 / MUCL 43194) TaxID=747089 RepID=U9U9Y6_RHIID